MNSDNLFQSSRNNDDPPSSLGKHIQKIKKKVTISEIQQEMEKYQKMKYNFHQKNFIELRVLLENYITDSENENDKINNQIEKVNKDEFNKFLQSCNVLSEFNPSLRKPLYLILTNFCIIKHGIYCEDVLNFFYRKVNLNNDNNEIIQESIQEILIPFLFSNKQISFTVIIINCLIPFVHLDSFYFITQQIVNHFKNKIININNVNQDMEKNSYLGYMIKYLCNAKKYMTLLIESEFLIKYFEILHYLLILYQKNDKNSYNLLSDTLLLGINIYSYHSKKLNLIEISKIKDLLNIIYTSLPQFKTYFEEITLQHLKKMNKHIADSINNNSYSLISLYSINSLRILSKQTIFYCSYISQLDKITINYEIIVETLEMINSSSLFEPIIINGICEAIYKLLKNKKFIMSQEFDEFTKQYSQTKLFNYLYGKSYLNCSILADNYGESTLENEKPKSFIHMNNEDLIQMIISIIKIIKFYLWYNKTNKKTQSVCKNIYFEVNEISKIKVIISFLDFAKNRKYLNHIQNNVIISTLVLKIQKLIKICLFCLFYLDFGYCDIQKDLHPFIELSMNDYNNNYSYYIYFIFTKIAINQLTNAKNDNNQEIFKMFYGKAFDTLRECISSPKYHNDKLIISILFFLINTSHFKQSINYQNEEKNSYKISQILYSEDMKGISLPIEIEKDIFGYNITNLYECFQGQNTLNPYSPVTLRLFSHINDILSCNSLGYKYIMKNDADIKELTDHLKKQIVYNELNRIENETKNFNQVKISDTDTFYVKLYKINEQKKNYISLFPTLLKFLMFKGTKNEISFNEKLDPFLKESLNPLLTSNNYRNSLVSSKSIYSFNLFADETLYEKFSRILREQPFQEISEYQDEQINKSSLDKIFSYQNMYSNLINSDIQNPFFYGKTLEKIKRVLEQESVDNIIMRSLIISSFLRGIYYMLIFSSYEQNQEMKKIILTGNILKDICLLTDMTKMKMFNISSKLLYVFYELINDNNTKDKIKDEEIDSLSSEHIEIIIYMICKIIVNYKIELSIQDNEHKNIMKLICLVLGKLLNNSDKTKDILLKSKSYEIILSFFVDIIIVYMKTETEILKNELLKRHNSSSANIIGFCFDNEILAISIFFGEIMSESEIFAREVLEELTKANVYNGIHLRKTFLREIIQNRKLSEVKKKLSTKNGLRINFIGKCIYHNTIRYVIIINDENIKCLSYKKPYNDLEENVKFNCNEWEVSDNTKKKVELFDFDIELEKSDSFLNIPITSINKIIVSEYVNRVFLITSSNTVIPILFYRRSASLEFVSQIMKYNKSIINEKIYLNQANKNSNNLAVLGRIQETNKAFGSIAQLVANNTFVMKIIQIDKNEIKVFNEDQSKIDSISNGFKEFSSCFKEEACYKLNDIKIIKFSKIDLIILDMGLCHVEIQLLDDISYMLLRKKVLPILILRGFISNVLVKKGGEIKELNKYDLIK